MRTMKRMQLQQIVYLLVVLLMSSIGGCISTVRPSTSSEATVRMSRTKRPPVAKKVKHKMEMFGDVRVDNYYWLHNNHSRSNPNVLSYLKQENSYTDFIMSGTKKFQDELYAELNGRMNENDVHVHYRKGPYYYYDRTVPTETGFYVQHCRRLVPNSELPHSILYDSMPTGPHAPPEHVILDESIRAQHHSYYGLHTFKVSPNNKLVAFAEDTTGTSICTIYVIDIETGAPVGKPVVNATRYLVWATDEALVYLTNYDKAWLHKLGTQQSSDPCLYHEKDDTFNLQLQLSESQKFVFVTSDSAKASFNLYLDVSKLEDGLRVLTPRVHGIHTVVSHRGNHFFIKRRSNQIFNSEIVACPLENPSEITLLLPHRESVQIDKILLFIDHLVVIALEEGLRTITIYQLPDVGQPLKSLHGGQAVYFLDVPFVEEASISEFSSNILQMYVNSMSAPPSLFIYDMKTGISAMKIVTVLEGLEVSNYVSERKWASAPDGTQIPITIDYRKDLIKLDGSDPLLLTGYGSYGDVIRPRFTYSEMSLLDRGFIYAIAHIRGGRELGSQWHENGKLLKKKNSFTDFIACAEYLIEKKYSSKDRLCISGINSGGLLMGAVVNMRPDLFKVVVAKVPYADFLTTMLVSNGYSSDDLKEWGDPHKEEFYFYIKSYSPIDNVKAQNYPNILVTADIMDSRVMYSEPAKFVAKLRDMKTNKNTLLFNCDFNDGQSKPERYDYTKEDAFTYAFIMKALDMIPA